MTYAGWWKPAYAPLCRPSDNSIRHQQKHLYFQPRKVPCLCFFDYHPLLASPVPYSSLPAGPAVLYTEPGADTIQPGSALVPESINKPGFSALSCDFDASSTVHLRSAPAGASGILLSVSLFPSRSAPQSLERSTVGGFGRYVWSSLPMGLPPSRVQHEILIPNLTVWLRISSGHN